MFAATQAPVLRILLSIIFVLLVLLFSSGDTAWWQRVFACIFAVSFGHHTASAMAQTKGASVIVSRVFIEGLSFVFLIIGVLMLPVPGAYVLLAAGFLWRHLLKLVWR